MIARDTLEFVLQRPQGFDFQAGQNISLKLSRLLYEDDRRGRRILSLASAPHEQDLVLATRLTGSGFKKTLVDGPLQKVELGGPRGKLLRDESGPAVFIAGGIGITPFKSMVLDALHRGLAQPMTLLYSNRTLADAAYHKLFAELGQCEGRFTYVPTVTRDDDAEWKGERRRIDASFIRDYVPDFNAVTFYLCGPPAMVDAVVEILKNENVSQQRILSESFWGY